MNAIPENNPRRDDTQLTINQSILRHNYTKNVNINDQWMWFSDPRHKISQDGGWVSKSYTPSSFFISKCS